MFNNLNHVLGASSFEEGHEKVRWDVILNSDCAIAQEFRIKFERHKDGS